MSITRRLIPIVLLTAAVGSACGTAGPEIRDAQARAEWRSVTEADADAGQPGVPAEGHDDVPHLDPADPAHRDDSDRGGQPPTEADPSAPTPTDPPTPTNRAPRLTVGAPTVDDLTVVVPVEALDPDGDAVTITITWPDGQSDSSTQASDVFAHTFRRDITADAVVTATDDEGATAEQLVPLHVVDMIDVVVTATELRWSDGCATRNLRIEGSATITLDTAGVEPTKRLEVPMESFDVGAQRFVDHIPFMGADPVIILTPGLVGRGTAAAGARVALEINARVAGAARTSFSVNEVLTETGRFEQRIFVPNSACELNLLLAVTIPGSGPRGPLGTETPNPTAPRG